MNDIISLSLMVLESCVLIFSFVFWTLVSGGSLPFVHCHFVVCFWVCK